MADKQISDLTSASQLTDGSLFVLEQAGAAMKANWGMMKNYISPGVANQYSSSATYDVGDYVIYNGSLYRCTTAITTAESWTAAHWTAAVLGDDITDVKSIIELSNSITPEISITPNPKTINNVFVNVLGPGKTYLYGTCSGDVRLDYYLDSSNLPDGFSRGSDYYAVVTGTDKGDTYISSYSGGAWVNILNVGAEWESFTAPSSGGLRISTFLRTGKTYDETMFLVILNKNAYTDMIANGRTEMTAVKNKSTETSLILDGSNLGVNYAAASTETRTFNGLTFTASGGNVTIDGTSSGVSVFDMFRKAVFPSAAFPFVNGKTYTISFHESDSTPIYKQVEYKATESSGLTSLYSRVAVEDVFTFTMPDCYDFYIRFTCDTSGRTYNDKVVYVDIKENSTQDANTIIVDASGNGDFILLKDGIAAGMKRYGTKVIVKPGFYNLVSEFGESYLDSLSGNDYGIMLGNGIELIFAPNAYVSFDYDGTNDWVIANFSPFHTANDLGYTIDGLHCTAHNCRYILHDDPRPGVKDRYSKNVIRNCYFELFPSTEYSSWVNHQIIGGGLGDSTMVEIENCIFNDHFSGVTRHSSVSYHNSTSGSGSFESRIIVKDNFFADGNILAFEGYGSSTAKTKVIVTNNCFENANTDITYSSASADNMNIYRWNNQSR